MSENLLMFSTLYIFKMLFPIPDFHLGDDGLQCLLPHPGGPPLDGATTDTDILAARGWHRQDDTSLLTNVDDTRLLATIDDTSLLTTNTDIKDFQTF